MRSSIFAKFSRMQIAEVVDGMEILFLGSVVSGHALIGGTVVGKSAMGLAHSKTLSRLILRWVWREHFTSGEWKMCKGAIFKELTLRGSIVRLRAGWRSDGQNPCAGLRRLELHLFCMALTFQRLNWERVERTRRRTFSFVAGRREIRTTEFSSVTRTRPSHSGCWKD